MRTLLKILLILALSFTTTITIAAESRLDKSFVVRADTLDVQKWIETNRDKILQSGGCNIISRSGDTVKLSRQTPKGLMVFTVEETVVVKNNTTIIMSKLTKSHQGGLTFQESKIVLENRNGKTSITVEIRAKNKRPDITAPEIRIDINKSIRGIQNLLENQFR